MSTKKHIIILSGFILCLLLGLYFQIRRENKLKDTREVTAIIAFRDKYHTKGWDAVVNYEVKDMQYESGLNCDCRDLEIGDTVLIKYSIDDPEVVVMVDKHYMQKYKNK